MVHSRKVFPIDMIRCFPAARKDPMTRKKQTLTPPHWWAKLRVLDGTEQDFNPRSLSLRAGLNATAVRDMIEGRSRFPRYDTVQALASALNTTPALLMGDETSGKEIRGKNEAFGKDIELLTEIIARLQETAEDMGAN